MGIYSRRLPKMDRRSNRHDLYEVQINIGSERTRYAELVGFISEEKQRRLRESLSLPRQKNCGDLREEEIVSIESLGIQDVYDIQTESGEYLSNNVAVHNCFILSVDDTMESILDWCKTEGMIFKGGSGSGINLSKIRSSKETLSAGGQASGPISFMRAADSVAGSIKSGGKTRRAAKMVVLNIDHPDVVEFIWCKATEEKKAWALGAAGWDMSLNGEAWSSIQFQNANNSVRVTEEFMRVYDQGKDWPLRAVTTGKVLETHPARDLMRWIAEAAWQCGDPGMQYDTTINDWHTCPNSGRINASNPCCITGDTLIAVADGRNAVPIRELVGQEVPVYAWDHRTCKTVIARMWNIGIKRQQVPVYRVTLDDGSSFRATDDHLIMLRDGSYRQVKDLKAGDSLNPFHSKIRQPPDIRTARRYVYTGQGWRAQYRWVWAAVHGKKPEGYHLHHRDFNSLNDRLDNLQLLIPE
ncbi:MAG: HNH endonuclease, partial [Candidatus Latescibacteria bacterium]|nr:HNH endonuclease [Candidatus Latescibacterota bacterium]